MTKEEFKTNLKTSIWSEDFPVWDLSVQDRDNIVELVMEEVEPLFAKIRILSSELARVKDQVNHFIAEVNRMENR